MSDRIRALLRRLRTKLAMKKARSVRSYGVGLHVGARCRFWAPEGIRIGSNVYVGKEVSIECNADIGNYVLIANRVALLGRRDHDFRRVGIPVRFSPWIGGKSFSDDDRSEKVVVEDDVWIGFGALILTGVRIERGAVVAAGSVVTRSVPAYSIVGGNPASVIGRRFVDEDEIGRHESAIRSGTYKFSERGYDHWIVRPGASNSSAAKPA